MTAALTAREVALRFGRSRDWLWEHRARLEAEQGFPPPLGRNAWDAEAVADWFDARKPAHLRRRAIHPAERGRDDAADSWAALLDANAATVALAERAAAPQD